MRECIIQVNPEGTGHYESPMCLCTILFIPGGELRYLKERATERGGVDSEIGNWGTSA